MAKFPFSSILKGESGEAFALRFLLEQGLELITRNYRCPVGEIDLIMYDRQVDTLVFVEVKLRKNAHFGHALETITRTKQQKIIRAIGHFLNRSSDYQDMPCRIDAIALNSTTATPCWVTNAVQIQDY